MCQLEKFPIPPPEPDDVTINKEPPVQAPDFTNLGSTVFNLSNIDKELQIRTGKASAAFGLL